MLPSLDPTFKLRFIQLKGLYGQCRRNQTDLLFNFQDLIVINSSLQLLHISLWISYANLVLHHENFYQMSLSYVLITSGVKGLTYPDTSEIIKIAFYHWEWFAFNSNHRGTFHPATHRDSKIHWEKVTLNCGWHKDNLWKEKKTTNQYKLQQLVGL